MNLPEPVGALLGLDGAGLRGAMAKGHPLEATSLAGQAYLGISLGLPRWVDSVLWKTFVKVFDEERDGVVRGWNVRMAQAGVDGPHAPLRNHKGRVRSFGHFCLRQRPDHALELDYGLVGICDPLVAIRSGSTAMLLGRTLLTCGPFRLPTPSHFALLRIEDSALNEELMDREPASC